MNSAAIARFDAHCDTLTRPWPLRRNNGHIDLERLARYAPSAQIFALWARPAEATPATYAALYAHAMEEFQTNADLVLLCRSPADAVAAERAGKIAAFLSVEGADLLGCSLDGLRRAQEQGVCMVNLVWNRDNLLCGSAMDGGSGLTAAGAAFVKEAGALGVAIDLSHASERTFWDVLSVAEKAPLCSHSNAKALCDHPRNLTDAQIRALVEKGGWAGINLCPDFIGGSNDIAAILAHIERFLSLGAEKALGLGADFDGVDGLPAGIAGVEDMDRLYEALLRENYSEALVRDLFFGNLMSYLEKTL